MAGQAARLIAAFLLAAVATTAAADARPERGAQRVQQTPWHSLKPDERRVLGPVQDRWDTMPGTQQQRLISSARKYPTLQPIQKERFDTRLREWATMTPEQRQQAREAYKGLRQLPPDRQHELRERWLQRHQTTDELSRQRPEPGAIDPHPERGPAQSQGAGRGPSRPDYSREPRPAPQPR